MKKTYNVIQKVEVELDMEKVSQEFLDRFGSYMWQVDAADEIAEHVARTIALFPGYSVEGVPKDFYNARVVDDYVEEDY